MKQILLLVFVFSTSIYATELPLGRDITDSTEIYKILTGNFSNLKNAGCINSSLEQKTFKAAVALKLDVKYLRTRLNSGNQVEVATIFDRVDGKGDLLGAFVQCDLKL